ncbi:hypothetical protein [Marinomonas shanghaiensis]|uniref:hypothetical protein n=1 Tax=Marinomonas shanghaiensis TaxID=2202418 RepID=UPI0013001FB6|nr:hypothetical protein [Marinomonas shanghaiensis]
MATKEAKSNDSAIGLLGGLITRNYEDNEIEEINAKNLIDRMNKELHASNDRTAIFNSFIEALTY